MLARLAALAVHRPRSVAAGALVLVVVAGVLGSRAPQRLSTGGFEDPDSESARAARLLAERFDAPNPDLVLLVTAPGGDVDDPAVAAAGAALTAELAADPRVDSAVSYWTLGGPPPLRSRSGDRALVLAEIAGSDEAVVDRGGALAADYRRVDGAVRVDVGGFGPLFHEITTTIEEDLVRAEVLALPVTLALLVVVFGTVVAALLPLAVGVLAILATLLVLYLLTLLTEVSVFALNVTTALGLGLAIDYALLVVSRFREELDSGHPPPEAVARTVQTAGRTVAFSAGTVAASLAALLVFPFAFLRSFAYAGVAVVVVAALASVLVLPALLALLGRRVDRLRIRRIAPPRVGEGPWHRLALAVMRRPVPVATAVVAVLVVLGLPFLHLRLGVPDDRVLPPGAHTRVVADAIRAEFSSFEASPLIAVVPDLGGAGTAAIDGYAAALSALPGTARVEALTGVYAGGRRALPPTPLSARHAAAGATYLAVVPAVEPASPQGEALARAVRAVDAPFEVLVGGSAAELADAGAALLARLPLALGVVGAVTFVLLFLLFGSVLVPAKAILLNLLSLTAAFGAMVWVFQDGHLAHLLDFTPTGSITITVPILMFCVAFGLSMDYEVFLLARIREEYDRTGDNRQAVAAGLERTGRIITAAAVLIAVVFLAFATGRVSLMKLIGIGLALAILVDAFLVRTTLVPAFMQLAGRANWWAPAPLRRLHARLGFSEAGTAAAARGGDATRDGTPGGGSAAGR